MRKSRSSILSVVTRTTGPREESNSTRECAKSSFVALINSDSARVASDLPASSLALSLISPRACGDAQPSSRSGGRSACRTDRVSSRHKRVCLFPPCCNEPTPSACLVLCQASAHPVTVCTQNASPAHPQRGRLSSLRAHVAALARCFFRKAVVFRSAYVHPKLNVRFCRARAGTGRAARRPFGPFRGGLRHEGVGGTS